LELWTDLMRAVSSGRNLLVGERQKAFNLEPTFVAFPEFAGGDRTELCGGRCETPPAS
jgi:hypothetical protein